MGYDLHITRAPVWIDSEEFPIPREEWHAFARRLSELREDEVTIHFRGSEPEPMFEYRFADDSAVSLYWYRGEIVVTGAVNELMAGAFVWLAESLGARLVGDDSEEFSRQPDEK